MSPPCRILTWDSAFFGRQIGRVDGAHLTPATAAEALQWAEREGVECLYFLAASDDPATAEAAEAAGFVLRDVRVTYGWAAQTAPLAPAGAADAVVRPAAAADMPGLEELARASHGDTRFFFDRQFAPDRAAELYAIWLRQSFERAGGVVLVPELVGRAAGYITCGVGDGRGEIGLVGLAPHARGRGLGGQMVAAAQRWFREQGAERVTVVTQGRNVAAQRLYQRAGFVTDRVEIWYHRWFSR
jgi:dTDP-4-amino-4,6-dideoxy-D-galactose acyltransferase